MRSHLAWLSVGHASSSLSMYFAVTYHLEQLERPTLIGRSRHANSLRSVVEKFEVMLVRVVRWRVRVDSVQYEVARSVEERVKKAFQFGWAKFVDPIHQNEDIDIR